VATGFEHLRLRRDTAATWTSVNPTLGLGEPGFETDTNKLKVGDGVTPWTGLAYITGGGIGADGAPGAMGPPGFAEEADAEVWLVPGPQGPQGIQGPAGGGGGGSGLEPVWIDGGTPDLSPGTLNSPFGYNVLDGGSP
jgi:hypothetical protein